MSQSAIDLERIVAEVLRALGELSAAPQDAAPPAAAPVAPAAAALGDAAAANASAQTTRLAALVAAAATPARPSFDAVSPEGPARASAILSPGALGPPSPPTSGDPSPTTAVAGEVSLVNRLVTLADLDGRWSGLKRVVVAGGAVVTPAVRDELERRGVVLTFSAKPAEPPAAVGRGPLAVALIVHGKTFDPAPLAAAVGPLATVRVERSECLIAASQRVAEQTAAGGLALLVTRHTAAALCLANRHRGVRAIVVADPARVAADAEAVGANALVASPQRGLASVKQAVVEFVRGGLRPCPEVFRKHLA